MELPPNMDLRWPLGCSFTGLETVTEGGGEHPLRWADALHVGKLKRDLATIKLASKGGPSLLGRGLESRGGNAQGGRENRSHVLTAGEIGPMG